MTKAILAKIKNSQFPIIVEKDEDGFYVVECPLFKGCYSQGKTLDEALKNIQEVIELLECAPSGGAQKVNCLF